MTFVMIEPAPYSLAHAVALVAVDVLGNPFDDEPVSIADAMRYVRDVIRLPEDPPTMGAHPLDDNGTTDAQAYRLVLQATDAEIAAALS